MGTATENIYENYDVTSGKFEKETTDCNATRIQSSELTGEGVKIRSSRAAAVCLILLCVLLLTAVIVLCVMFTGERQQLISKNDNLTDERDQLISKNDNLTDERNQLISKINNLTNQRDVLIFMNENLTRERDQEKINLQRSLDGWIYYQSSLYFISSEMKSWNECRRYCRDRGADLIIINNPTEQKLCLDYDGNLASVHSHVEYMFLQNLVRHETQGATRTWIGGYDAAEEGVWLWSDGTKMNYQIWSPGQPDNHKNEHCLEMNNVSTIGAEVTDVFIRSGENVRLPCNNALSDCTSTTWIYNNRFTHSAVVELITLGIKNKDTERRERLSLGSDCSLNIKNITEEDSGLYTCQQWTGPYRNHKHGPDAHVSLHVRHVYTLNRYKTIPALEEAKEDLIRYRTQRCYRCAQTRIQGSRAQTLTFNALY
ncbi:Ladderlectin [Anabarilius grahami]|uniref:Ladderlectin n=1 Tax=Anabarilius grahami TaxID=495550 RepID=A0A3N0YQM1_ANAGA|nr:Ladderlectin [Anabarilius grahami]